MPRSVTAGLYGRYTFGFWRNCRIISQSCIVFCILPGNGWISASPHAGEHRVPPSFFFFANLAVLWGAHCGFTVHFPNSVQCWRSVTTLVWYSYVLLDKIALHFFIHFEIGYIFSSPLPHLSLPPSFLRFLFRIKFLVSVWDLFGFSGLYLVLSSKQGLHRGNVSVLVKSSLEVFL